MHLQLIYFRDQGRLNSIIGHGKRSALGSIPTSTQPLTGIKLQMSIKLNIKLLHLYFQQNQFSYIKKHAIHNKHRLS